jgi:predicted alpha/beta superfamily hydrolase
MAEAAQLPGTEVHLLESKVVGDTFEISVLLPPDGVEGPLPVIYCTDANIFFGAAANAVSLLTLGGGIPPALLVGVGYPSGGDFQEFLRLRTRDFSPSEDAFKLQKFGQMAEREVTGGGAEKFISFLTTELRDWLSIRFNLSDDHTFIGDSMGGLFGTYALLNHPQSFNRYIIGSPWLCWDHPVSFRFEEEYAATHDDLAAKVFLAAGGDEHVLYPNLPEPIRPIFRDANTANLTQEMSDKLNSRNYPGLDLTIRILPNETHFTIIGALIAQGLRVVFT